MTKGIKEIVGDVGSHKLWFNYFIFKLTPLPKSDIVHRTQCSILHKIYRLSIPYIHPG